MSDNNQGYPRIYTIHSQKGGVGKTSIALAIAGLESCLHNKKTLIIDADFTGTSIGDLWPEKDIQTVKYFNELILAKPNEFEAYTSILPREGKSKSKLSEFYFKKNDFEIYFMPGSPIYDDILKIVPLISQEDHLHFFKHRLEDIIVAILRDEFEVVIIDNPPGLFGLSRTSLVMAIEKISNDEKRLDGSPESTRLEKLYSMAMIDSVRRSLNLITLLVTSPDEVDHKALVPSFDALLKRHNLEPNRIKNNVYLINNRASNKEGSVYDPIFAMNQIFNNIGNLKKARMVRPELIDVFRNQARVTGAVACQLLKKFDMAEILSAIMNLKSSKKNTSSSDPGMKDWCRQIALSVGIQVDRLEPRI